MAALAADRQTNFRSGGSTRTRTDKVAANAVIYFGALIGRNAAGFLVPASDAASLKVAGIAQTAVNNTGGADGAVECTYVTGVTAELANLAGAIVRATAGRSCFVGDDQSVTTAAVSVNKVFAGRVCKFTAATVEVYIDEAIVGMIGGELVANVGVNGTGIPQVAVFDIADAASADYDIAVLEKIEVLDIVAQKTAANGGAANTVQAKSTAAAISDAMSLNINDTTLARAATINDANSTIAAGGILRASVVKAGGNAACKLMVTYVKRA